MLTRLTTRVQGKWRGTYRVHTAGFGSEYVLLGIKANLI